MNTDNGWNLAGRILYHRNEESAYRYIASSITNILDECEDS